MPNFLNAGWWMKRAFQGFVTILGILLFLALATHTPFGPLLFLGGAIYIAYRIWGSQSTAALRPPQRSTRGAERTPVLPGGEFHQ